MEPRTNQEEEDVKKDIDGNHDQIDHGKLGRTVFVAQISHRNAAESIDSHRYAHNRDKVGVSVNLQRMSHNRRAQHGKDGKNGGRQADTPQDRAIDPFRVVFLFIYKAEKARLHTISKDNDEEGGPSINVCIDAIFRLAGQHVGVERSQAPVEETS